MALTYKLIASSTVGSGGAANIEFTSIPATYTDLLVKISTRSSAATTLVAINLSLNSSTSNFSSRIITADGSTIDSYTNQARRVAVIPAASLTASTFSNDEIYLPNYTTSNNKSYSADSVAENNGTTFAASLVAGLWSDSAVISSITLTPTSGSFVQYSTAYLYGIKNS
jgi:hypothetical protein